MTTSRRTSPNGDPNQFNAISQLYAVERQAGLSIQASILTTWIAAATYFTGSATLLAFMAQNGIPNDHPVLWLLVLPVPAWALANYHLILFFAGFAHAKSIAILEEQMVSYSGRFVKEAHKRNPGWVGARAETSLTEFKFAKRPMKALSIVAYSIPYTSVAGLTAYCVVKTLGYSFPLILKYVIVASYSALLISLLVSLGVMWRKVQNAYDETASKPSGRVRAWSLKALTALRRGVRASKSRFHV